MSRIERQPRGLQFARPRAGAAFNIQFLASHLTPGFQSPQALGLFTTARNVLACGMSEGKQTESGATKSRHALPDATRPVNLSLHAHAAAAFARPP
jgi:hypothetical protein